MWRVESFDEIDSTNSWVAAQSRAGAEEGLVASARYQTAGKGRLDRRWESPVDSALLCSILLRPDLGAERLQLAVAAVALSAREALRNLSGLRAGLKWPNDLVVGHDKLAGLLAEVIGSDGSLAVVVGIGINLTDHPQGQATSLLEATGVTCEPSTLLAQLLEELAPRRVQLDTESGRRVLRNEYEGALTTLGTRVRVETSAVTIEGIALRVDDLGRLVVASEGREFVFSSGDVVHLRAEGGAYA